LPRSRVGWGSPWSASTWTRCQPSSTTRAAAGSQPGGSRPPEPAWTAAGPTPRGVSEMFERFTARARRAVVYAQQEARERNHHYVGTEHLLLGLMREPESVAARALQELKISQDTVREHVIQIVGRGQQPPSGHVPFTPRAKKVLELALREALQLSHNYIGTEHIVLALVREGEGVAAKIMADRIGDLSKVRPVVLALLSGPAGDPGPKRSTVAAEEAAARKMELRVQDEELHLIFRDSGTVTEAAKVIELSGGPITGTGPLSGAFVPLWTSTNDLLRKFAQTFETEPSEEPKDLISK